MKGMVQYLPCDVKQSIKDGRVSLITVWHFHTPRVSKEDEASTVHCFPLT